MRAFGAGIAAGVVAWVATPAAAAPPQVRSLPWPPTVLPRTPPLAPANSGVLPLSPLLARQIETRERIVVGVDDSGRPHSVRVLQRILVKRLADYVFTIPAPVRSVTPGPGTESVPGQRENQILWEGFSPGRRVLAAWADLRVGESSDALPVEVRIEDDTLTVTNRTAVTVRSFTAEPDPVSLDQVLRRIRAAIRGGVSAEGLNVGFFGEPKPVPLRVAAPLRVSGAANGARFSGLLDGIRRAQLRIRLPDGSPPKLTMSVRTAAPPDTVTSGQPLARRLAGTIKLELSYARKRQYDMFLASPDQSGPSSATYVYRIAAPARPAVSTPSSGSDNTVVWIVLGLGLAAAVPTAAVIWAHS
jgi:hypothetical protein